MSRLGEIGSNDARGRTAGISVIVCGREVKGNNGKYSACLRGAREKVDWVMGWREAVGEKQ